MHYRLSDHAPVRKGSGGGTRQAWVQATISHPTGSSCRLPVDVLISTGAGGGNYASGLSFAQWRETQGGGGGMFISKGKGLLRAASSIQNEVPLMNIVRSCEIPLVFRPEDRVKRITYKGYPMG